MTALFSTLGVVAFLVAIVAVHLIYFYASSRGDARFRIMLPSPRGPRNDDVAIRSATTDIHFEPSSLVASVPWYQDAPSSVLNDCQVLAAEDRDPPPHSVDVGQYDRSANRLIVEDRRLVLEGITLERQLVCTGDVEVRSNAVIGSCIKVHGDLNVGANVTFLRSVIVNGDLRTGENCVFLLDVVTKGRFEAGKGTSFARMPPGPVDPMASGSMAEVGPFTKYAVPMVLNVAALVVGTALFAFLVGVLGVASCVSSLLIMVCEVPPAPAFEQWPHLSLLLTAVTAWVASRMVLYRRSIAPFFLFVIAMLIFCVGFDVIFQLPVRNFSRLLSSTFNLTSFIIFLSFSFIIAIVPYEWRLRWRFIGAMMQSYLGRDLAFLFYVVVQREYIGMTSLYLMFVAFSFGAITIHIMSIAGILRRSGELWGTI
jgi:hypothetical protein